MNEQYLLHLNNFKSHLEQLNICKTKVEDRLVKANRLEEEYSQYLQPIQNKTNELFVNFKTNLASVNLAKLNEFGTSITFLREENNFYINSFDVLSSGENDLKKNLKNEISKINFLVDAALKLKFFIVDRFSKIIEKYNNENHNELTKVKDDAIAITDKINVSASLLNAETTFLFTTEMETCSRLQTLEATINELTKRFSSIG